MKDKLLISLCIGGYTLISIVYLGYLSAENEETRGDGSVSFEDTFLSIVWPMVLLIYLGKFIYNKLH